MKAIILAGGYGIRLRPTTKAINKHLLPVWNKPLILYGIIALKNAGIKQIILSVPSVNPHGFMELLEDGDDYGVQISYVYQHKVKGIAWAINEAKLWLDDEPFVVYLGDNIFVDGIKDIIDTFKQDTSKSLVALKKSKLSETKRYGVAVTDSNDKITGFIEKPSKPISQTIILGLYCLNSSFFKIFPEMKPSSREEYEITDALNLLLPVNYRVYEGVWWDCGTYSDFITASKYFKNKGEYC